MGAPLNDVADNRPSWSMRLASALTISSVSACRSGDPNIERRRCETRSPTPPVALVARLRNPIRCVPSGV